ncbi:helix-turn-helix transcriptional regulator [Brucella gallinifaecis]|uniref:ArsR/SmtB family transcription factor n=1 Tax=Brucella gallinifaecis TaxID=215590 RepID=UPI002362C499|nr:helix-turn-helix transcriptional regulator [Brucella gallinifaecis]
MKITNHPSTEEIRLDSVMAALSSPLRLAAVRMIAQGGEHPCCAVLPTVGKSTMTHHFRILRDSGVVWQRRIGQEYRLSLRREDLDARFPGLLDSILRPLYNDPLTLATLREYQIEK